MTDRDAPDSGRPELTFESFGVRVRVVANGADELERVRDLLPPGAQPCPPEELEATFTLHANDPSAYELRRDDERLEGGQLSLDSILGVLDRELRAIVALEAPSHIFVHAGVVGYRGAAIVMPASSLAGKTSLVAALVRAGAEYYSDEFAPLDSAGHVHPFPKPLSIRNERYVQVDHHVDDLGGVTGHEPLPIGMVVITSYESGAAWRPRQLSSGEAVLALLAHTLPAQTRSEEALRNLSLALEGAVVLEGARGEADAMAPLLLAELERTKR